MSWLPDHVVAMYRGYVLGYDECDDDETPNPFILFPNGVDSQTVPTHFIDEEAQKTLEAFVDNHPYYAPSCVVARLAKSLLEAESREEISHRLDKLEEAIYGPEAPN